MTKLTPKQTAKPACSNLKVRIIKAPLVDSVVLREVLAERQKALVL